MYFIYFIILHVEGKVHVPSSLVILVLVSELHVCMYVCNLYMYVCNVLLYIYLFLGSLVAIESPSKSQVAPFGHGVHSSIDPKPSPPPYLPCGHGLSYALVEPAGQ